MKTIADSVLERLTRAMPEPRCELDHQDAWPDKVERDLCAHFPQPTWPKMQHRLILHGRYVCIARKPKCVACALNELCPERETGPEGSWEERADAMEGLIQS